MSAITPATKYSGKVGNFRLVIAKFSTVTDGDEWTSKIKSIVGFWSQTEYDPTTQTSVGLAVALTTTNGVFTFYPAENANAQTLFVLYKG